MFELCGLDLRGRTVVDIGCGWGYHSFAAHAAGARMVLGVDQDPRSIRICRDIQRLYSIEGVKFLRCDALSHDAMDRKDVGLLINFFGKNMIADGRMDRSLSVLASISSEMMFLTARPRYSLNKHLKGNREAILRQYGEEYIQGDDFLLAEYILQRFANDWYGKMLQVESISGDAIRVPFLFRRRGASVVVPGDFLEEM